MVVLPIVAGLGWWYFHQRQLPSFDPAYREYAYITNGKMTGGLAFVAYPAEYGNSGVMTFMMNQDGVLLQKDLGKNTTETATAMTLFDPDSSWTIVEE